VSRYAGFFSVKADGAYCYLCALKGEIIFQPT